MALRDQPYIPLYVQDFSTDEKLVECSASATGVFIRLMCIMHKSDDYGIFLLKQNDKRTDNQITNFAIKLNKHMPYPINEIERGLIELIDNGVLILTGDMLMQKRMIRDAALSSVRSKSGKAGAEAKRKAREFADAKIQANILANM